MNSYQILGSHTLIIPGKQAAIDIVTDHTLVRNEDIWSAGARPPFDQNFRYDMKYIKRINVLGMRPHVSVNKIIWVLQVGDFNYLARDDCAP